jgi:hypothetical protein
VGNKGKRTKYVLAAQRYGERKGGRKWMEVEEDICRRVGREGERKSKSQTNQYV